MAQVNQFASMVNDIITTKSYLPQSTETSSAGINMPLLGTAVENTIPKPMGYGVGNKLNNQTAMTSTIEGGLLEKTLHKNLDPRLWTPEEKLIPEVREQLLKIALFFRDLVDFYVVEDIKITGSEANYNYEEDSDIDLHLVYNFQNMNVDPDLLSTYFKAKKQLFNNEYDITIKGIPVEIGVEDINTPLVATGSYSLLTDEWILKPTNSSREIPDIYDDELTDYCNRIEQAIESHDKETIQSLWREIKNLRKDSLYQASGGEFAKGNLIYKRLRSLGYITRLRQGLQQAISKELSLETAVDDHIIPSNGYIRSML